MKTALLLGTLTALLMFAGGVFGLYIGGDPLPYLTFAFAIALVINFVSYYKSDKIVLSMYHAKDTTEDEYPGIYRIVRELTTLADMPMPKIVVIPTQTPNAFATGRNVDNAVVAVTEGSLSILSEGELRAVISHELSHILNKDMFISTLAAVLAAIIGYLGQLGWWMSWSRSSNRNENNGLISIVGFVLLLVFIPIAATIIRMAISRDREFGADRKGAELCMQPDMLARALIKIEQAAHRSPMKQGNQSTASLFIINPFKGGSIMSLLSTHPPTSKRIEKLNELSAEMGRPTVMHPSY